jgi:energy-coupling factor transporter ATP-binding protein EcfA2
VTVGTAASADIDRDNDIKALRELAGESLSDPRIANYFSRGHVQAEDVLEIMDNDNVHAECRSTDAFQNYAKARDECRSLGAQVAAASSSINWRTALIALAAASIALLMLFELIDANQNRSIDKILLSAFSTGSAILASLIAGKSFRNRKFNIAGPLAAFTLFSLSVCAIALPLAFDVFPWQPILLYINLGCALAAGIFIGEERTAHDLNVLGIAAIATISYFFTLAERQKYRKAWLGYSLTEVVYPNAVLAINRILGEDSTKLLVEQNSEGLRRLQDSALTVPTRSEFKLRNLREGMDGGSIAVTGPRGAGKSTLLRQMCSPQGHSAEGQLSIYTSAPAEYVAREFIAELFQQVCDAYLRRYDSSIAGMRYQGLRTRQDTVRILRRLVTILRLALRMLFAVVLLTLALGPLIANAHSLAAITSAEHWRTELTWHAKAIWGNDRIIIQIAAGLLAWLCWPSKSLRHRRLGALRQPELIQRARSYLIHLQIERTTSWGANLSSPLVRGTGLSISKGISEKYIPWSMPELVGKLRDFIQDISQNADGSVSTTIIGIDEIDRIGSIEQAERFIGEVKAIFGIPNCFFLVSVAEDVGFLFSRRSIVGSSTLEHSFDDVVVVDALELDEARELLCKRVIGFTDSFVFLALALSGGLPREMIRVVRRLVDLNHREADSQNFPRIGDLTFRLVAENIAEVVRTSRNQLARLTLPDSWGGIFCQLRDAMALLQSEAVSKEEQRKVIGGLCSLRPSDDANNASTKTADETAACKIVVGLAAFASYSITVIEAFDNNYFDLGAARKSTLDTGGGSYMALAAARLELGISPESSQLIIRRFRARSGLGRLPGDLTPQRTRHAAGRTQSQWL